MDPMIIGLYSSGPQSGKTTVAKYLVKRHGFVSVKFAQPIRDAFEDLCLLSGMSPESAEWYLEEGKELPAPRLNISFRSFAREFGTDFLRRHNPDLFIDILERSIRGLPRVVIDDVRFPNEFRFCASRGEMWHLWRPQSFSSHHTEGQLGAHLFDHYLSNNGSLEELHRQIETCI